MNLEISIPHRLDVPTAAVRLREVAARHDVELDEAPGETSGTLAKKIPLLGAVLARYELRVEEVHIVVTKAPSFLSSERVRSLLEGELGPALRAQPGDAEA